VQKAEADYEVAKMIAGKGRGVHDVVCFHCQQSAEKYFKAVLQERVVQFPRTHNLLSLLALLPPADQARLRGLRRGLTFLERYAVDVRYPGVRATKRQAGAALRWATRTRDVCRVLLRT
jgi:HEPN domain-containing protein